MVLLLGPWLDVDHPMIKLGALPITFEAAFNEVGHAKENAVFSLLVRFWLK